MSEEEIGETVVNPRHINLKVEKKFNIDSHLERSIQDSSSVLVENIESEWEIETDMDLELQLHSSETFGGERKGKPPYIWRYCYLVHNPYEREVYFRTELLQDFPKEAEVMLKHELTHIILFNEMGVSPEEYFRDPFLSEATAGLENATEKLTSYMKKNDIQEIPDISKVVSYDDIKSFGGNTDEELFIEQPGYLFAYSFGEYLKKNSSPQQILDFFKRTVSVDPDTGDSLGREIAYQHVFQGDFGEVVENWRQEVRSKINDDQRESTQ